MKENNTGEPTIRKRKWIYSLIISISALLLVAATVLSVYFVTRGRNETLGNDDPVVEPSDDPKDEEPETPPDEEPDAPSDDEPADSDDVVKFVLPVDCESCSVEYGAIYTNATLNKIYRHMGVDFAAAEGTSVCAIADGTVASISCSEDLGNVVAISHGEGLVSYYRFIEPKESLAAGDSVRQGEVIGTVAAAYGTEYKDGAHLHFELELKGESVDPAEYLDLTYDEK